MIEVAAVIITTWLWEVSYIVELVLAIYAPQGGLKIGA